jgi:putative RecB family exonuclease
MAKKTAKKITSWSFSRYSDYKQCPLKAKLKHLDKINEPPNAAMARGSEIHTLAEQYIKGDRRNLPAELKQFKPEFAALRKQFKKSISGMVVEDTWAFTKDWTETQWDNWTQCFVRIKLDCAHHEDDETLIVSDWKTGKFRPEMNDDYIEQLELYALAALLLHPHIEQVKPRLVYIDQGIIYPDEDNPLVFKRSEIEGLKKLWAKRIKAMVNDTTFAPRPNDKCRWCHYRNSNKENGGGQCRF